MNRIMHSSVLGILASVAIGVAALVVTQSFNTTGRPLPVLPVAKEIAVEHVPFGPVRPARVMPAIAVTMSDGGKQQLPEVVSGHWTIAQLMFTGCSTTCPVQGAIFEQVQNQLGSKAGQVKLLSLSIDPLGDTPEALQTWIAQFGAGPQWQAAVTGLDDLGPLLDVLNGRGEGIDVHNARVFLISPEGELVYVTEDMPSPRSLIVLLDEAMRNG